MCFFKRKVKFRSIEPAKLLFGTTGIGQMALLRSVVNG